MSDEWANLTNGSFKGVAFHAAIPNRGQQYGVESEEVTVERRLQFIERPLVDGASVNDWGSKAPIFAVVVKFFGPNHDKDLQDFFKVLDEGTPGPLILPTSPKAVLACFWKRGIATTFNDGNGARVTVTWASDEAIQSTGTGKAQKFNLEQLSKEAGKANLDANVSNALGVLQDNPFLTAVRTFEKSLSKTRSVVNAVLTLEDGVRNRIASIDANIKGTLALIKEATDEVQRLFGSDAANAAAAVTPALSLGTNAETGQTITDFSEPDVIPPPVDALAPPPLPVTLSVPTNNLGSFSGVANFGDVVAASLASDRDEMAGSSGGRTEDVARALTTVLNSFTAYIRTVQGPEPVRYTTPVDMCLGEILFFNGIDLSELRNVLRANSHIDDPFFVPKGTDLLL